ncbi:MAG: cytochrome c oxidase subunit 3 [Acidobacteriota bacterium]|nr:cytochrome c oxidase subunit 3 [Blastocatellia bacterium]MDW8240476.1 cytochrome c oxidase subunit 3 [Acidobacteriota bacterium]
MVATLPPKPETYGRAPGWPPDDGGNRDNGGGFDKPSPPPSAYRLGMGLALVSIFMLFVAFTSAYVIRQGQGQDWQPINLPVVLWLTTALLLLSSVTLERARQRLRHGDELMCNRWLTATTLLGLGFLIGQFVAWRQLAADGIYINTNPHSSFFYMLTAAHGLHLAGGLVGLGYITVKMWRQSYQLALAAGLWTHPKKELAIDLMSLYWHFMDGLWVYLFVLLFAWT